MAPNDSSPTSAPGPSRPRPARLSETERKERFETDLEATRSADKTRLALAIVGRLGDDGVLCPDCGKAAPRGKFKIHPDGGWKHFSADGCHGDGLSILQRAGIPTGDAVKALLGRPTRTEIVVPDNLAELGARLVGEKSSLDLEVFNGVLTYGRKTGGVEAAQAFYGTWHISPEAVAESGAVMITDPKHFAASILAAFGDERLLACGLFTRTSKGALFALVNDRFPVVEPHRHPRSGDVLYMQFRGSHAQHERYLQHKAGQREYKGSEKIISLRGAPRSAQIGTGLPHIETLPAGSTVHVVEGFKDGLAGRTVGLHTYGLPGVGVRPPVKICQLLARHTVLVAFDEDEAGINARDGVTVELADGTSETREGLVEYLRRNGVANVGPQPLAAGLDMTDTLVAHHASGRMTGTPCLCPTCTTFRAARPASFPTG